MEILGIIVVLFILLFSAILHEIAHGYVADRLGDPTARLSGRLTLNPLKHIDLYMSILLPVLLLLSRSPFLIGGAKPVPIDPFNLKEGRKDVALVSLSGPLTNILLAVIAAFFIKFFIHSYTYADFLNRGILSSADIFSYFFFAVIHINLLLAIFNLLPIPPLDGSKIFALLLPERDARAYLSLERFSFLFLLLLFFSPGLSSALGTFIFTILSFILNLLGI